MSKKNQEAVIETASKRKVWMLTKDFTGVCQKAFGRQSVETIASGAVIHSQPYREWLIAHGASVEEVELGD